MSVEAYEVLAVEYARTERPSREFYLLPPDPHEGPRPIAYYLWVVRNSERTVVVDLGFDRRSGEARGRKLIREPVEALAAVGVDAGQVETVIVTHMHYDHAGHTTAFPNARFIVQEREIAYCTGKAMGYAPCRRPFDVEHVTDIVRANFGSRVKFE